MQHTLKADTVTGICLLGGASGGGGVHRIISRVSPKGERLRNLLSQSIFQFATLLLLGGADFGPTDTFFGVFFALI